MDDRTKDAAVRIGCGATLGAFVGVCLIVNLALSPWHFSAWTLFGASVATFTVLGYILGDRLFHSAGRWLRWFQ
jgi:hypothetical protein